MTYVPTQHFHFHKNGHSNEWAGGGAPKKHQKCHEINKIQPLTSPKTNLENASKVGTLFYCHP